MSKLIKYFIAIFLLLPASLIVAWGIIGCKPSINFEGEYKLNRYIGGKPQNDDLIIINDELQQEINDWLKRRHWWCIDLNSYVPGSIVHADNFSMNCIGNIIVLNFKSTLSEGWMQYSCPMNNEIKKIFTKLDALTEQKATSIIDEATLEH